MNGKLKVIIAFNLSMAAAIALIFLNLDFISQFAALLMIFIFPAAGLVLFRESDGVMKIARGFVYSTVISMGILALFVLGGIPVQQGTYLAALVATGNFFLLYNLLKKKEISFEKKGRGFYQTAALVAVIAGGLSFWGATRVVPVLQDHDSVMECPAYGLATTLKPYCIETRVPFYFAKGPTSHFIYAFPLVLTDKLERVKHYYNTSQAALTTPDLERKIVGMWHAEFKRWFPKHSDRVVIETRTTSVFISVMLALLLFAILSEIAGSTSLALVLSVVFATLPEIFVRDSYAGYQNISNFFLLLALYYFLKNQENALTALLLATINQKCVIVLGLAVGTWLLLNKPDLKKLILNKTLIALLIGMLLLYAYGAIIHPESLLKDQFQRHGVDRLLHQNPNKGMAYPSLGGLWSMFAFNYGVFFLLLVLISSLLLIKSRQAFPRATVLLFLIMATAFVFSIVDWKMTKHLDLMIPAMMLVTAYGCRAELWRISRPYRNFVAALLGLVLINNGWIIYKLAENFSWLKVTPIW
jgi:hypothetical protein